MNSLSLPTPPIHGAVLEQLAEDLLEAIAQADPIRRGVVSVGTEGAATAPRADFFSDDVFETRQPASRLDRENRPKPHLNATRRHNFRSTISANY